MIDIVADTVDKLTDEWRPTDRQEDFFAVPDSIFEVLYGGAAGGGKSEVLLMLPIVRRFYLHPLFHGIVFRRTFPQLESSLIRRALNKLYKPLEEAGLCQYNSGQHVFTFKSSTGKFDGAQMRFSYMETDDDARKHKTSEYNYAGIDEASEFSPYQLTYIQTRIRSSVKDLPKLFRLGSNPGGPSHAFLRDRFVKPFPQGYKIFVDKVTKEKRMFIPAKIADNPHLVDNDPNYANRLAVLKSTNEAEYKALADGDWFSFSGQVFTEFRDIQRPGEPANALHVIEPFQIPDYWPKIMAVDWGFDAWVFAILGAISPDDRVFIFWEYRNRLVNVSTWAADLAQRLQYERNFKQPVILDPSAWQRRGDEKTIEELFRQHGGLSCVKADNDRISGKMLVHEYLRWENRPPRYVPEEGYDQEKADRVFRLHGQKALDEYRGLFLPEKPEANLPKLQVFANCIHTIDAIKTCQYAERKKDGKSTEDVREWEGDDPYDTLRYFLKGTKRYYQECAVEDVKFKKTSAIVEELKKTNDYNAYAQQIRRVEATHKGPEPVIRRRTSWMRGAKFH